MSRKLRLLAGYVKGLPIWCSWQVTPRCASFCAFCEHRAEGAFEELDLAGIRRVSEELGTAGALMVSLSGGDPLLREDLPEVVRTVARHHFPLVTTHGLHVTRERARALWESGLEAATVTLDHADAVRQDAAAGMPGSHGRAVLALAAFAATRTRAGQQVNVKTRLRAETLEGLDDLLKLAAEQGASVTVEPAYPLPASLEGIKKRLRDLRSRRSNLRIGPFFLDHIEQALAGGVPGCQAGRAFFNVDQRGRVTSVWSSAGPRTGPGTCHASRCVKCCPACAGSTRRTTVARAGWPRAARWRGSTPCGGSSRRCPRWCGRSGRRRSRCWAAGLLALALPLGAQAPPAPVPGDDAADLVNSLLTGLLGFGEVTEADLQAEVAEAGGVPFKTPVALEYMGRSELKRYVADMFEEEYPASESDADARTARRPSTCCPRGPTCGPCAPASSRRTSSASTTSGPIERRLYVVSEDRTLTPMNQLVLSHELRHALQDQYMQIHDLLAEDVSDYDDRQHGAPEPARG